MKYGINQLVKKGKLILSECKTQEELYRFLAKDLMKENLVKESFSEALLKREQIYPTGIVNQPYNIALPHVDAEHVNTNALILCRMENPILFRRMDNMDEKIPVKMVFLLLIESLELHMPAIVSLTDIWSNPNLMEELLNVKDKEALVQLLSLYTG